MVVALSSGIPEFTNYYGTRVYQQRLEGKKSLILVANYYNEPAGFKVAYDKYGDGSLYSWMGAVLPHYRKKGIAKSLASHQEAWAKQHHYKTIRFKTRNNLKPMLMFALNNNFNIISVETKQRIEDYRIILEKDLK